MPHQPRRYPTMTGLPPELTPEPRETHPPVPVKQDSDKTTTRRRVGLDKLNIRTHEPDFDQLVKTMFGKEATHDTLTGRLVFPAGPGRQS